MQWPNTRAKANVVAFPSQRRATLRENEGDAAAVLECNQRLVWVLCSVHLREEPLAFVASWICAMSLSPSVHLRDEPLAIA